MGGEFPGARSRKLLRDTTLARLKAKSRRQEVQDGDDDGDELGADDGSASANR